MAETKKIRSLQDILAIRDEAQKKAALREDGYRMCFTVHMGTCGIASGARDVVNALAEELEKSGRTDIRLTTSGCIGACEHEPVMTVETPRRPARAVRPPGRHDRQGSLPPDPGGQVGGRLCRVRGQRALGR